MRTEMTEPAKPGDFLRTSLNLETSRIAWKELLRFFAAGTVIAVGEELDLVDVAVETAKDNAAQIEQWMAQGKIGKVSDAQAKTWLETDATVWAVVVRPWILVQQDNN
jgi:hypothetical protein